jgi:DNA mismatch repair protein MutL
VPRIHRLASEVIDRIAAGEVVERPSSVVKELVENALDAGATRIDVEVEGGGASRILVRDDGCGMSAEDARLALERHATSKISTDADLASVSSYGFRGEALPSIASVSRLTLTTSDGSSPEATRLVVDYGKSGAPEPAARPRGTDVLIEDLFARTRSRCDPAVARLSTLHPRSTAPLGSSRFSAGTRWGSSSRSRRAPER